MTHDPVNHPSHYTDGGIETIDFIEAKKLPYHLGNAVKYISRAGKKDDEIQDLKKAVWYINRYIELREKEKITLVDVERYPINDARIAFDTEKQRDEFKALLEKEGKA